MLLTMVKARTALYFGNKDLPPVLKGRLCNHLAKSTDRDTCL